VLRLVAGYASLRFAPVEANNSCNPAGWTAHAGKTLIGARPSEWKLLPASDAVHDELVHIEVDLA
jgi:hypothetical protein